MSSYSSGLRNFTTLFYMMLLAASITEAVKYEIRTPHLSSAFIQRIARKQPHSIKRACGGEVLSAVAIKSSISSTHFTLPHTDRRQLVTLRPKDKHISSDAHTFYPATKETSLFEPVLNFLAKTRIALARDNVPNTSTQAHRVFTPKPSSHRRTMFEKLATIAIKTRLVVIPSPGVVFFWLFLQLLKCMEE